MDEQEIKKRLYRKATVFQTGGMRPQFTKEEPWIGAVHFYLPEEGIPLDQNDKPMRPLLQVNLGVLPFVSTIWGRTQMFTVFISRNFRPEDDDSSKHFCIREYEDVNVLVKKEFDVDFLIKPFPMSYSLVEDDSPAWDSADVPVDVADAILEKEDGEDEFDYFEDIWNGYSLTKVGGYASYIQGSLGFPAGYEFALQIASDAKANLNIVDSGNFYFAKNLQTGLWYVDCDFY